MDADLKIRSGWIDRRGTYHPVGFERVDGWLQNHDAFARKYLIEKYGSEKAYSMREHPVRKIPFFELLEKAGWVKIHHWPFSKTEFIFKENNITHAQKQTLDKYCTMHHLPLPFKDPLFD